MTGDERKRKIESIEKTADRLTELARAFDRMRYVAEKPQATDAFVDLVDTAGKMTESSLQQLATLIELLTQAGAKTP